ncbi:PTS sugar transporter subunit IIA [Mycoplasma sp. 1018B]|uniref:PTS sugar transporter subunit IIA n=1 Tax=Mycoplasma sp. 1018B TaxID=2967302 RepID=UPI00211C1B44|nr:PTS sugar transporter subunit IIA [Mycoplasma sp. 1018B]UUM18984.1 PTS sugar transporter subunit IIA [Mycoplasma sp. 1018B]
MKFKDKMYITFLTVITLGFCWIYWKKQQKHINNHNNGIIKLPKNINLEELILFLGQKNNLDNVNATTSKVTIHFKDRNLIELEKIKNLKYVSGIMFNENKITLIVGNIALSLAQEIIQNLNN